MEPILHGKYYHIFNRGNNREDLFRKTADYNHFLKLYEKHVSPVAETFAWALMKNHFHLLIRIKDMEEIAGYKLSNADRSADSVRFEAEKWETVPNLNLSASKGPDSVKIFNLTASEGPASVKKVLDRVKNTIKLPDPTRHFSHFFNAYSKYINNVYERTGSLFETPFRRKPVYSNEYFRQLVVYIHHNPEHHGFTSNYKDYPWSSYASILSVKPTRLARGKVVGWFDDTANFITVHEQQVNCDLIQEIFIE